MTWKDIRQTGFIFLVSLAVCVVLARVTVAHDRTPRVVLLGSGDHVAALVVAGDARLLIATGTDGPAFLNAFASALPLTDRRVDIAILAGGKIDLPVAAAAKSSIHARRVLVLEGGLSTSLADLGFDSGNLIAGGTKLTLTPDVSVSFETTSVQAGGQSIEGWQAIVEHGNARVRIVSDARLLASFRDRRSASALVIASKPGSAALAASFLSLIVPAAVSDAGPLFPKNVKSAPVAKVESGRALTLTFVSNGLKLPNGALPIDRPTDQTGAPARVATAASSSI